MSKTRINIDVNVAARHRIRSAIQAFPKFYVAFSGGKDSGVLLNLVIEEARGLGRLPVDVLFIDLEAQYKHTIDYVTHELSRSEVRAYWIALPLNLRNAVSQIQTHWLCWDPSDKESWVRQAPSQAITKVSVFPFFKIGMEFEEFVPSFGEWISQGQPTACFIGIRTGESLNRYRTITNKKKQTWESKAWTTKVTSNVYNVYPIYDWETEDIWIANGKFKWQYNRIYDLMHLAGVSLHTMRICQPYGDEQRKGLWLFKLLEPDTWSKVVNRVMGVNFGNRYVSDKILGNHQIALPENHTYKSYAKFLLSTMPPNLAQHYRKKIYKFLMYWRKHGAALGFTNIPDKADFKLEASKKAPSWRRICKVLLKNDYWCKGLSFAPTKYEHERQLDLVTRYI